MQDDIYVDSLKSRLLFLTSSSSATSRSLHCRCCCSSSSSSSCLFSSRRCFWRDDAAPRSAAPPPVDLVGRVRGLAGLSEGSAGCCCCCCCCSSCCCCCCCWRTFLTSEGRRERDHFSPQHSIGSRGYISVYGACSRDAYKRNGPAQRRRCATAVHLAPEILRSSARNDFENCCSRAAHTPRSTTV